MAIPNITQTGRTGMMTAKAGIATTGHNIANSTTEGYSRQKISQTAMVPVDATSTKGIIGMGTKLDRVDRVNDQYLEKQLRNSARDMSAAEDKDMALSQTESVFNELGGDGINRLMARFFNEFRKLANEPENMAVRESVRESSQALINDMKRVREAVLDVSKHIDSRMEGYVREINALAEQVKTYNIDIKRYVASGASPNDLLDKRDLAMKQLGSFMKMNVSQDNSGGFVVDAEGLGPIVVGPNAEKFSVERSPANDRGKPEGAYDIKSTASAVGTVTNMIKGGKMGALIDVRDRVVGTILARLDDLAYSMATAVNDIHKQGFTADGLTGVAFFKEPPQKHRAAEFLDLSDQVKANSNFIATAGQPDSPADNRVAVAIYGLQEQRIMNDGKNTMDDYYNSIVSDVGVAAARNKADLHQAKDIANQLGKFRDQLAGVSIDEETTNLLQFQHAFDASAKVIQVGDELLKTVLSLKG